MTIFAAASSTALLAQVEDSVRYMHLRDDKGTPLCERILGFRDYDYRKDKADGIRVVITGCIQNPGIYILDEKADLEAMLQRARPITLKTHPVRSYLEGVQIFRRGLKMSKVDATVKIGQVFELRDGDVINILAFTL